MERRLKTKIVWRICAMEYGKWLRSSRLIILAVMAVFIHVQIVSPLAQCAQIMGEPVAILEGFLALGNSGVILLVLPILFLVLVADFPIRDGTHLFCQIRCRKRQWVAGQTVFATLASLTVVVYLLVITCIMMGKCGTWQLHFSDAVTHFVSQNPERAGDYIVQLMPGNLYQQLTMPAALAHSFALTFFHFLLLAMILLLFSLCGKKYAGILTDGFLIIFGAVTCETKVSAMWIFPMAHTVSWLHFEEYLSKAVFPMWGSYLYLVGGCVALGVGCLVMAKKCRVMV